MKKFHDAALLAAVGRRIRAGREARGLSQADFALALDVPIGTLRNWEQGRRDPGLSGLQAVATALELALAELLPLRPAAVETRRGRPKVRAEGRR